MISAIKEGDESAFELAYMKWRAKGFQYFFRKTGSEEDAKDLIQSVFLKLWLHRGSLNGDFSLDQQLFYIARNVLIDYIRKANKQQEINTNFSISVSKDSLENYQSMEFDTRKQIRQILNKMPEMRQKVFQLHKLEGYSYKEIAEFLCITEKSVDNHLAKALKRLRRDFPMPIFFLLLLLK